MLHGFDLGQLAFLPGDILGSTWASVLYHMSYPIGDMGADASFWDGRPLSPVDMLCQVTSGTESLGRL